MLEAAIAYAARGWPVIALMPGRKQPLHGPLVTSATLDCNAIRRTWATFPAANVAIATGSRSGVVAVDLDVRPDSNGIEQWERLAGGTVAPTCSTMRGGRHLLFAHAGTFRSSINWRPGIDLWGELGAVILPPSVVCGIRYEWLIPPADEFPPLPQNMRE